VYFRIVSWGRLLADDRQTHLAPQFGVQLVRVVFLVGTFRVEELRQRTMSSRVLVARQKTTGDAGRGGGGMKRMSITMIRGAARY